MCTRQLFKRPLKTGRSPISICLILTVLIRIPPWFSPVVTRHDLWRRIQISLKLDTTISWLREPQNGIWTFRLLNIFPWVIHVRQCYFVRVMRMWPMWHLFICFAIWPIMSAWIDLRHVPNLLGIITSCVEDPLNHSLYISIIFDNKFRPHTAVNESFHMSIPYEITHLFTRVYLLHNVRETRCWKSFVIITTHLRCGFTMTWMCRRFTWKKMIAFFSKPWYVIIDLWISPDKIFHKLIRNSSQYCTRSVCNPFAYFVSAITATPMKVDTRAAVIVIVVVMIAAILKLNFILLRFGFQM